MEKPWRISWKHQKDIAGGGQGITSKVQHKSNGTVGCLKLLKNNDSVERRGRFRREVIALQTLRHPSIPKILDENTDRYEADDRLYMVTEFVDGPTMSAHCKNSLMSFHDAISTTAKILQLAKIYHSEELVHRDIKPDNVIFRGGDIADPVLVDFGLAYVPDTSFITPDEKQQLGNRFIHLPELQTISSDKRNPVSDLTQICGLLYFMISGLAPETLQDEDGLAPHQRSSFDAHRSKCPDDVLSIFDRGFRTMLAERWQSCDELTGFLIGMRLFDKDGIENMDTFEEFANALANDPSTQTWASTKEVLEEFRVALNEKINEIISSVPNSALAASYSEDPVWAEARYVANRFFYPAGRPDRRIQLQVQCQIVGNEAVLSLKSPKDHNFDPIARTGVVGQIDWTQSMHLVGDSIKRAIVDHLDFQ